MAQEGTLMGTIQRNKRLRRELAGRARPKVMLAPFRDLAGAMHALGVAFHRFGLAVFRLRQEVVEDNTEAQK